MMKKLFGVLLIAALLSVMAARQTADATAILDKAITALGGAEKLEKIKVVSWKAKGTITFQDNANPFTSSLTVQGLDRAKQEFDGEFGGNPIHGVSVLAGDKGWRVFGDMKMPIDNIPSEKRNVYLNVIPVTLVQLKGTDFKLEALSEEKIADKAVTVLKVTPPDKKDFKLYFDKESGLPVRLVAKVLGFQGEECTQETNFSEYKEMAGIKKATKISSKRDGEKFIDNQITEFTVSDKEADAKTFAEP
jgi:outer membrane lipoprotein-sorting protein